MNKPIALQLIDLHKSFGTKEVHKGVSLDLHRGEILALLGQILFNGQDVTRLSERRLTPVRIKIAYVFQNGALFDSLSVEENLAYPLREHTKMTDDAIHTRVNEMLESVDMKGSNNLLPAELSGGMQKRAGLARATILNPEIVLFDEPTAGLDPINTRRLVENIHKLKQTREVTGIFVTHDIPAAFEIADRIAILYNGKIYVNDTVENIKLSKDPLVESFISGLHEESGHHPS
jgi:phospholipid/cholesterol/gamma-HCH transport system ATP-binding protein